MKIPATKPAKKKAKAKKVKRKKRV
jgi:hypothetical protein